MLQSKHQLENAMRNEHTANQSLEDYNAKEYALRQAWERVLKDKRQGQKVLTAPAKPAHRKPVVKLGFFSRFFKVV